MQRGNMNEEKEISESETSEMLSYLKTSQERDAFRRERYQRIVVDGANIGLAQYNEQNGTNFELDKISCENHCFFSRVVYFHVNFIAESSDGSNDEKKRRMFFAEVVGLTKWAVSVCCILDPVAGMESGCEFCGHRVYHPCGVCLGPSKKKKKEERRRK